MVFIITTIVLATSGCDMRHAIRIQLKDQNNYTSSNDNISIYKVYTYNNVMTALSPIITSHNMTCEDNPDYNGHNLICKTWSLSATKLKIREIYGAPKVIVEDESFIFLWTPQPYGDIRKNVQNILIKEFGAGYLSCVQGFGFHIPCTGWPIDNESRNNNR